MARATLVNNGESQFFRIETDETERASIYQQFRDRSRRTLGALRGDAIADFVEATNAFEFPDETVDLYMTEDEDGNTVWEVVRDAPEDYLGGGFRRSTIPWRYDMMFQGDDATEAKNTQE